MRILVIEDDKEAASYLVKGLSESGHVVDHALTGDDGLHMALTGAYDVDVVDRMLPCRDGLSVITAMRAADVHTPVLILSALGEVDARVEGLRAGGDDYLTKPFAFSELLQVADLELDFLKHKVSRAGKAIHLQPREFRLLKYLMQHAGQVVTRTMLLENVWDYHFDPQTNVIDVHISRLRAKIDKDFDNPLLHTVRGAGYCLREPD
ncbi:MAG: response regulator transcription factor [Gammaproteobacteria bacterium]